MEQDMFHKRFTVAVVITTIVASSLCPIQADAGLIARLNRPIVPGMPTLPGMPAASPLGLIAPRLSNAVLMVQKGGLRTPAGRLGGIGILSPRVSPVAALVTTPPKTRQARMLYGLTILSPRTAVLVAMLQGFRGTAAGLL